MKCHLKRYLTLGAYGWLVGYMLLLTSCDGSRRLQKSNPPVCLKRLVTVWDNPGPYVDPTAEVDDSTFFAVLKEELNQRCMVGLPTIIVETYLGKPQSYFDSTDSGVHLAYVIGQPSPQRPELILTIRQDTVVSAILYNDAVPYALFRGCYVDLDEKTSNGFPIKNELIIKYSVQEGESISVLLVNALEKYVLLSGADSLNEGTYQKRIPSSFLEEIPVGGYRLEIYRNKNFWGQVLVEKVKNNK